MPRCNACGTQVAGNGGIITEDGRLLCVVCNEWEMSQGTPLPSFSDSVSSPPPRAEQRPVYKAAPPDSASNISSDPPAPYPQPAPRDLPTPHPAPTKPPRATPPLPPAAAPSPTSGSRPPSSVTGLVNANQKPPAESTSNPDSQFPFDTPGARWLTFSFIIALAGSIFVFTEFKKDPTPAATAFVFLSFFIGGAFCLGLGMLIFKHLNKPTDS